ncbi:MAG: hypothetical protein CR982_06795 [Candidatus Cloacimonadota bacterium]|nr:MAG: hypothetical protein CR982_06795 [Candidatus Cloacimonadota bacterium]PIE77809.1 MAG: hypothetical protein CSA15_10970 [Candidatus Delongbacteria bacterium]
MVKNFFIVILVFLFFSCEFFLADTTKEESLVLFAFSAVDSTQISVKLSKSLDLGEYANPEELYVSGADITLYENDIFVAKLSEKNQIGNYIIPDTSNFTRFKEGFSYKIIAQDKDKKYDKITAETICPTSPQIESLKNKKTGEYYFFGDGTTINDTIIGRDTLLCSIKDDNSLYHSFISHYKKNGIDKIHPNELKDLSKFSDSSEILLQYGDIFYIEIFVMDNALKKYLESLDNYNSSTQYESNIYSNVMNGYGLFSLRNSKGGKYKFYKKVSKK